MRITAVAGRGGSTMIDASAHKRQDLVRFGAETLILVVFMGAAGEFSIRESA